MMSELKENWRLTIFLCERVRLSKRRAKGGAGVQAPTNAILEVTHRSLNDQEVKAQEVRKMQLEPADAEYEDDEDDKDEEKETVLISNCQFYNFYEMFKLFRKIMKLTQMINKQIA